MKKTRKFHNNKKSRKAIRKNMGSVRTISSVRTTLDKLLKKQVLLTDCEPNFSLSFKIYKYICDEKIERFLKVCR